MKTIHILIIATALFAAGTIRLSAQESELEQMKKAMKAMEQTMEQMKQKIADLEAKAAAQPPPQPPPQAPPATNALAANSKSYQTLEKVAAGQAVSQQSPVTFRDTMNDAQEAASRPKDYTLDPTYRGFIPVPNTPVLIKFNAKPHVDFTSDNKNADNKNRFVPAVFPLQGDPNYGGGEQFHANANATQLRLDVRAPEMAGDFRFY